MHGNKKQTSLFICIPLALNHILSGPCLPTSFNFFLIDTHSNCGQDDGSDRGYDDKLDKAENETAWSLILLEVCCYCAVCVWIKQYKYS